MNTLYGGRCVVLLAVAVLTGTAAGKVAWGQPASPGARGGFRYKHRIDPRLRLWPKLIKTRGRVRAAGTPALLEFIAPPTAATLELLEYQGVRFSRRGDGSRRHLGRFYPARLASGALGAIEREASVGRVALDRPVLPRTRPLDRTVSDIHATHLWSGMLANGVEQDGTGTVIGSLDSGIDVFHPAFFRADGPIYRWIDSNSNGVFDPGVDGIDLNGDGRLGAKEKLSFFDGQAWEASYTRTILSSANNRYDIGLDYLYVDLDGDGKRGFGPEFGENTPTYGEPLFVADDVNGNGRLDIHEKVRALGTSKIRAVSVRGQVYRRGVNLSATPNEGYGSSHGNGTSGILVGGQRGYMKRVGVAPGADLVLAVDDAGLGEGLAWLVGDEQVDVVLHEYSVWLAIPLDGSGVIETMMDEAAAKGIPQVVPAGNLEGSGHTAIVDLAPGQSTTLPIEVPNDARYGAINIVILSFHWRTLDNPLSVVLEDPTGAAKRRLTVDNTGGDSWDANTLFWSYRDDSSRGTARFDVIVQGGDGVKPGPVGTGSWTVTLANEGSAQMQLHAYVGDDVYGWARGATFGGGRPPASTVCWPSTADSAITVGAYAGRTGFGFKHPSQTEAQGGLRAYSSRGTRIDGQALLDIVAPDNPLVPINQFSWPAMGINVGHGSYSVFSGTSGSGPHVAGAVALLLQQSPELSAEDVRARLHAGALSDNEVKAGPKAAWGAGKLRVYETINQRQVGQSTPPTVRIVLPRVVYEQVPVDLAVEVHDDQDDPAALKLRWDADYDGSWDGAFASIGPLHKTFAKPGGYVLKAQVRDSSGLTGQAVAHITVVETGAPVPDLGIATDSGIQQKDSGVSPADGSMSRADGSVPRTDAGTSTQIKGGCQLIPGATGFPIAGLALLGLMLIGRARRRR